MKWLVVIGCLATLTRCSQGNVLRCLPGSQESSCIIEKEEERVSVQKSDLPSGKDCAPGTTWKTECNTCSCQKDGTSVCTKIGCRNEHPMRCKPGSRWVRDCNSCYCTTDGLPLCTKMGCVTVTDFLDPVFFEESESTDKKTNPEMLNTTESLRKVRALAQEPKLKACKPGSEFRMDCNTCLCDDEGQDFSCTRIDCNAVNNNNNGGLRVKRETTEKVSSDCTPGSVFERGCNVCRCSEVGYALCTTNKCKDHSDKDQTDKPSTELQGPEFDANFRCNPGEQYSFDCNDCTCSADGKSIFCTIRFCEH